MYKLRFLNQSTHAYGVAMATSALLLVSSPALGQAVISPGSTVAGKTISAWTADWWSWSYSMPASQNPILDETGAFANVNQTADVFFIAGNTGGTSTRSFTVPANTPLLFPLVNVAYTRSPEPLDEDGIPVWSSGKPQVGDPAPAPPDFVRAEIFGLIDEAVDLPALQMTLNGQTASALGVDLTMHREQLESYTAVVASDENWAGEPVGNWTESVSDGYWVMLDGLPLGDHTLQFGGTVKPGYFGEEAFVVDVTANIRAVPEPTSGLTLAMFAGFLALAGRARKR